MERAIKILQRTFGYREFRPLQSDIIQSILNSKDTVVIMPTGGGKSLCYQIPALIFDGLTVVVSPLISLMKDQVQQLHQYGIPAVYLNSTLSWDEYRMNMDAICRGEVKMLYVAPETLNLDRTLEMLKTIDISLLAIDEAHCISEWGHDFRPEYRMIASVKKNFPDATTVALTATATPRVQEDIAKNLGLENPRNFIASFDRKNLMLEVVPKENARNTLLDFIKKFPDQSGIIYCSTRKDVDKLAEILIDEGYSALPYHAGLENDARHEHQEKFIRDDVQIIVATIAFGMGINKPNVRFIVHYSLPKNIESYYQQIGRAGRDGMGAHCLLIFGYGDIATIKYFNNNKEGTERAVAEMHLQQILDFAESRKCRRKPLLEYFGEKYEQENCGMCDNCLGEPQEMADMTVPAQKFLSCMKRTGEMFGMHYIIDILRGSEQKKILEFNHNEISTYGIGKDLDRNQWLDLARQFRQMDLIEENEKRGLELTQKAWKVLRGIEKVFAFTPEPARPKKTSRIAKKKRFEDIEYDKELFEILREQRKAIADDVGVPPYAVFPDRSFIEMAQSFPRTQQAMLRIHGVGKHKYRRYGRIFIDIISDYCDAKGIEQITRY